LPARDRDLEERAAVSRTLAAGVGLSAALLLAALAGSALGWDTRAWTRAGVMVMVATPYLRVLQLAALFARRREWRFVVLAIAVFALMGAGAALGLRG